MKNYPVLQIITFIMEEFLQNSEMSQFYFKVGDRGKVVKTAFKMLDLDKGVKVG